MIYKALFTTLLLFLSYSSLLSQDFKKEFFSFDDFSFIDEMQHADFNGDGLPDFLIAASNFGKLQVGINTGISPPVFSEISDVTYDIAIYIYIYIYIYIHIMYNRLSSITDTEHTSMYKFKTDYITLYIYIYRERERER